MNAPKVIEFDYSKFDHLMNVRRDFEACLTMTTGFIDEHEDDVKIETDVYKKALLAMLMCRELDNDQTVKLLAKARSQPGWTQVDEGDLLRDVAINLIRHGELEKARECLNRAFTMHSSDLNRVACLWGVYARVEAEDGNLEYALKVFSNASKLWACIDDADPIWINNARFHWLMTMSKAGVGRFTTQRRQVWWRYTLEEQNLKKKVAASLLQVGDRKAISFIESRV